METPQKPVVLTASHPQHNAMFRAFAVPTKDIKSAKANIVTSCSQCLKPNSDDTFRRCSKCKAVWYCSQECQKLAWPQHKTTCKAVEGSGVAKILQAFIANPILMHYLHMCIVLKMDLVDKPNRGPFLISVDVGIHPTLAETFEIMQGSLDLASSEDTIQGMLQITAVTASPSIVLTPNRMALWKKIREATDAGGCSSDPVAYVEMIKESGSNSFSFPTHISAAALQGAQSNEPFVSYSALTGKKSLEPMNADSCIGYINWHIRADKQNQLKLRSPLRRIDVDVIKGVARVYSGADLKQQDRAVQALHHRMKVDPSYTCLTYGASS